jgi:hypothetical protein
MNGTLHCADVRSGDAQSFEMALMNPGRAIALAGSARTSEGAWVLDSFRVIEETLGLLRIATVWLNRALHVPGAGEDVVAGRILVQDLQLWCNSRLCSLTGENPFVDLGVTSELLDMGVALWHVGRRISARAIDEKLRASALASVPKVRRESEDKTSGVTRPSMPKAEVQADTATPLNPEPGSERAEPLGGTANPSDPATAPKILERFELLAQGQEKLNTKFESIASLVERGLSIGLPAVATAEARGADGIEGGIVPQPGGGDAREAGERGRERAGDADDRANTLRDVERRLSPEEFVVYRFYKLACDSATEEDWGDSPTGAFRWLVARRKEIAFPYEAADEATFLRTLRRARGRLNETRRQLRADASQSRSVVRQKDN